MRKRNFVVFLQFLASLLHGGTPRNPDRCNSAWKAHDDEKLKSPSSSEVSSSGEVTSSLPSASWKRPLPLDSRETFILVLVRECLHAAVRVANRGGHARAPLAVHGDRLRRRRATDATADAADALGLARRVRGVRRVRGSRDVNAVALPAVAARARAIRPGVAPYRVEERDAESQALERASAEPAAAESPVGAALAVVSERGGELRRSRRREKGVVCERIPASESLAENLERVVMEPASEPELSAEIGEPAACTTGSSSSPAAATRRRRSARARFALVVLRPLLFVAQGLVRRGNALEHHLGGLQVVGVLIRVPPDREFPVRFAYRVRVGVAVHAQDGVEIFHRLPKRYPLTMMPTSGKRRAEPSESRDTSARLRTRVDMPMRQGDATHPHAPNTEEPPRPGLREGKSTSGLVEIRGFGLKEFLKNRRKRETGSRSR